MMEFSGPAARHRTVAVKVGEGWHLSGVKRFVPWAHVADVVLGIYPFDGGMGLHVIKGDEVLRHIANTDAVGDFTHTAIAVHNREQAVFLQAALAA